MKISPTSSLLLKADLQQMYSAALNHRVEFRQRDISRLMTVRASQLPFCPLRYVLQASMVGPNDVMNFYTAYFTSVGTVVHEVMQTYHGKSGKFLANWKCPECGKFRKLSHRSVCPKCKTECIYEEVQIRHKWISGHIDGVFRDRNGKYWIIDYKTTSTALSKVKEKNPGLVYREQVEAYAYTVQEQYGIEIEGVALVFICRDNPTTPVIWSQKLVSQDYKDIAKRLKLYYELHKQAYVIEDLKGLRAVWEVRMCQSRSDVEALAPDCLFKQGCKSNQPTEAIAWFKQGIKKGYIPIKTMVENQKRKISES